MGDELWFSKLEFVLFTHFQEKVKRILGSESDGVFFTTESNNDIPSRFPTIHFEELPASERGMDLDNVTVNAVNETIQVFVYAKSEDETRRLMNACVTAMKQLRFNAVFPRFDRTHDISHGVARFRRVIGAGDFF